MAEGMMGYGQALGSGKVAGETPGGIKPPKLPSVGLNTAGPKMGMGDRGPKRMMPPPAPSPIRQPPQAPMGSMSAPTPGPAAPAGPAGGPTTRASRLAAAQSMYAPGGAGWAGMGVPAPPGPTHDFVPPGPPQPDPWGVPPSPPMTGGGFMAGPPPGQTDPAQGSISPDMMQRIQMLMQTNPQMLMRALGMA